MNDGACSGRRSTSNVLRSRFASVSGITDESALMKLLLKLASVAERHMARIA